MIEIVLMIEYMTADTPIHTTLLFSNVYIKYVQM